MADKSAAEKELKALPPYVSYKTFVGFVQRLKQTVVPPQIDSSVLRSYAGGVARKLTAALKFLRLVNADGRTTPTLSALAKAHGMPEWPSVLSGVILDAYKDVVRDLDLEIATPAMLDARFRAAGAEGTTLQACVAFFVAGMKDAKAAISPLILNRPRSKPTNVARPRKRQDEEPAPNTEDETVSAGTSGNVRFAFPLPGKAAVTMFLPSDLTADDWAMVDTMVRAYVDRRTKA